MSLLFKSPGSWPLFGKELIELAARKQTYILRVVYALVLFVMFWVSFENLVQHKYGIYRVMRLLGSGQQLFEIIVVTNFWAIYLILPALMSGVVTFEKERDSLHLLILTDLRPREILLQKYYSRLLPMLTFILLSLPLMGLSFSFGGIGTVRILVAAKYLVLTCLQVGAYALMISCYCRTTSMALVLAYSGYAVMGALVFLSETLNYAEEWMGSLFGFYWFGRAGYGDGQGVVIITMTILFFLGMARRFLLSRAFLPPRNVVAEQHKKLDATFEAVNERLGGVHLRKKSTRSLPDEEPVAWRERARRSLNNSRYLTRNILLIWVPVFVVLALIVSGSEFHHYRSRDDQIGFTVLLTFMWPVALLLITISGVNLISMERSNQTLDMLAVTPLTGRELVLQKMSGLRPFMAILGGAFCCVFLAEAWLENHASFSGGSGKSMGYLLFSFLSVLVYFPMFAWLAMLCGLKYTRRTKATMLGLTYGAVWIVLPFLFTFLLVVMDGAGDEEALMYFLLSSPAMIVAMTELAEVFHRLDGYILLPGVINFLWHLGVLHVLRSTCLENADRYLGRGVRSRYELPNPPVPDTL